MWRRILYVVGTTCICAVHLWLWDRNYRASLDTPGSTVVKFVPLAERCVFGILMGWFIVFFIDCLIGFFRAFLQELWRI
jgi:hypothetical protein